MKKILLLFVLLFSLLGCGSEEKEEVKQEAIPYSFYETYTSSVKLQGIISVDLIEDKLPTVEQMKIVAQELISQNPNYENYFFRFEVPFTKKRPEKKATDFRLYYNINKLGDNDFEVQPLFYQLPFNSITLNEKMIDKLGINKISNISPISIGTSIEDVVAKLGEPSEKTEDTYSYYVVNDRCQMFGVLYVSLKDNKVTDVSFYSSNLKLSKNQLSEIKEYVLGNKALADLNIRELEDIYPFSFSAVDFEKRLYFSRISLGDIDETEYITQDNSNTFDFIIPAKEENYVKYTFDTKSKNSDLIKVSVVSEKNTDDNYDKFLWDLCRALVVLDPECNFLTERIEILKKLNFLYDQFSSNKSIKASVADGKYKYTLNKSKSKVTLVITENK